MSSSWLTCAVDPRATVTSHTLQLTQVGTRLGLALFGLWYKVHALSARHTTPGRAAPAKVNPVYPSRRVARGMHTSALALIHNEPRLSLAGRRVYKQRPTAVHRLVVPVRFHRGVRAVPDKHLNNKQLVGVYNAVALQFFAVVVRKVQTVTQSSEFILARKHEASRLGKPYKPLPESANGNTSKLEAHRREEGWPLVRR